MTERKGPGFSLPDNGWDHAEELHLEHLAAHKPIELDPELKERLDASLAHVREEDGLVHLEIPVSEESQKRVGRGLSKHFLTMDTASFLAQPIPGDYLESQGIPIQARQVDQALMPANVMDVPAVEQFAEQNGYKLEKLNEFPRGEDFEIKAKVEITQEDLMSEMAEKGAKQIMAHELNRMFAEQGITTHYTAEMLSALAAERLRAEQKRKKKARINKRKRK